MVQGIAAELANRLAVLRTGIEHQHCSCRGVRVEHREHLPLGGGIEMKKAVPGQDAVETAPKRQLTHVGHEPFMAGQALVAKRDHRRR